MANQPTQIQMFYLAHRRVMDMYHTFIWIMEKSGNPLTQEELIKLAPKYPFMRNYIKKEES